jgi:hypothetical protein
VFFSKKKKKQKKKKVHRSENFPPKLNEVTEGFLRAPNPKLTVESRRFEAERDLKSERREKEQRKKKTWCCRGRGASCVRACKKVSWARSYSYVQKATGLAK